MNHKEAKELTDRLTPINCVKLALLAAEQVYPFYKKYDENDTVVIGAINAARNYIENPCKEAADAAHAAANAADVAYATNAPNTSHAPYAVHAPYAAAYASYAASYAAWSTDFAAYAANDANSAVCSACKADDTLEAKIRDYAAKLIAEQGE